MLCLHSLDNTTSSFLGHKGSCTMDTLDFLLSDGGWSSGFEGFVALFLSYREERIGFTEDRVTTSVLLLMAHLILTDFVSKIPLIT